MSVRPKSPISWLGGKYQLASFIVSLFPDHKHYIEVFAGALHVLFAKPKSKLETVNDANEDLMNFWLVARDHTADLIHKIEWTPYSRALFLRWKNETKPEDPVEWAARWFFLNSAKVNNVWSGGWGCSKSGDRLSGTSRPKKLRAATARLWETRDRLAQVQIERADFRTMLERYAKDPGNLLYLDPPYIGSEAGYVVRFSQQDHIDLAELLNACEARVLLTYEDHPQVRELYKDWSFYEVSVKRCSQVCKPGEKRKSAIELLLTNYDIQLRLFS